MRCRGFFFACLFLTAVDAKRFTPACGTPVPLGEPAIVYGVTAEYGPFPWHVGVYKINRTGYYNQICGGTLISSDLVISAAHCFYDETNRKVFPASEFKIAGGKFYRSYDRLEPHVQKTSVKSIDVTENYIGFAGNYAEDIALVRLETPFNFTALVKPICMDWDNLHEGEQLQNGTYGKVVGWGYTEEAKPSEALREISLPVVPDDNCIAMVTETILTEDKFCAGYLNGSSICSGDSGGGLCFEYRGLWYLRGIVSTIPGRDGKLLCDNHQYAAFTNVGRFRGWIRAAYDGAGNGTEMMTGCVLPEQPVDGSFQVTWCQGRCNVEPGVRVPVGTVLVHRCDDGYSLHGIPVSTCEESGWDSLSTCTTAGKCPPLVSSDPDVVCDYQGDAVPCSSPMDPGTRASLNCPVAYKISGTRNSTSAEIICLEDGEWDRPTLQCVIECGVRGSHEGLVVYPNGLAVRHASFPWYVGIAHVTDEPSMLVSIGTLIGPDLVLMNVDTFFNTDGRLCNVSKIRVMAGPERLSDLGLALANGVVQISFAKTLYKTDRYDRGSPRPVDNIALIRLATPFNMTTWVRPVCIDWNDRLTAEHLRDGTVGKIPVGFAEGPEATTVDFAYVSPEECRSVTNNETMVPVTTETFCVRNISNERLNVAGFGVYFESEGIWYVRGVRKDSFTTRPIQSSFDSKYHVITNVGYYLGWIRSIFYSG